ncbi:MAG TPA: hypothetical protein DCZ94_07450, partial [Lentisphaeria bacterium]|nr:hypothetical protein [Lentisphaeria bacterium]
RGSAAPPFLVGYFRGLRKEYEGGAAEPLDVLLGVDVLTSSVSNFALASLMVILGFILLIIPGIVLAPILPLTIFFLAKGETYGLDALRKAIMTLKKNPFLIAWNLVFLILIAIGTAAFFIKLIFALLLLPALLVVAPVFTCATYMLFEQLTDDPASDEKEQNYRRMAD